MKNHLFLQNFFSGLLQSIEVIILERNNFTKIFPNEYEKKNRDFPGIPGLVCILTFTLWQSLHFEYQFLCCHFENLCFRSDLNGRLKRIA